MPKITIIFSTLSKKGKQQTYTTEAMILEHDKQIVFSLDETKREIQQQKRYIEYADQVEYDGKLYDCIEIQYSARPVYPLLICKPATSKEASA